jgi:uncharacterized protein (TIGR03067 family)
MAFAPAPFPKAERNRQRGDDLAQLQGWWLIVSYNGRPHNGKVEVKDKVWNNNHPNDMWTMTIDPSAQPKRIDLKGIAPQTGSFRGIYKIEGDTLTYSLRYNAATEADRPRDYDISGPGAWVMVFKRIR